MSKNLFAPFCLLALTLALSACDNSADEAPQMPLAKVRIETLEAKPLSGVKRIAIQHVEMPVRFKHSVSRRPASGVSGDEDHIAPRRALTQAGRGVAR